MESERIFLYNLSRLSEFRSTAVRICKKSSLRMLKPIESPRNGSASLRVGFKIKPSVPLEKHSDYRLLCCEANLRGGGGNRSTSTRSVGVSVWKRTDQRSFKEQQQQQQEEENQVGTIKLETKDSIAFWDSKFRISKIVVSLYQHLFSFWHLENNCNVVSKLADSWGK